MALPTITLDDRTFEQLFAFMRRQIDPADWLDHNYSDPGIALLDLLCWVGEMTLYTADRIPPAHVDKFASLLLDPPEPVTVQLTLTAAVGKSGTLPARTRFATDFFPGTGGAPARRFVFETLEPLVFKVLATAQSLTVTARELMVVENEALGTSTGSANQMFPLRPVHANLGLPADQLVPVLSDFVHRSAADDPNPQVTVGGAAWNVAQFLATEASQVVTGGPAKPHYMVQTIDGSAYVRFGDDRFGSIPAAGAPIVCTRYRVLQGSAALIAADTLTHQLDAVAALDPLTIENTAAEGGRFFFKPEERIAQGLRRFNRPARLITANDFEAVMMVDFNEVQQPSGDVPLLRAVALMNVNLTAPETAAPGHVTIVVLVASPVDLDLALTDPGPFTPLRTPLSDLATKQALVTPTWQLADKLRRFLDRRRLLTTRIHVAAPTKPVPPGPAPVVALPALVGVSVTAVVAIDGDRNAAEMTATIKTGVRTFFGVVSGGAEGKGWPLGGSVYRSKLFRLLEDIDGVDHVAALTLGKLDGAGNLVVDPGGDVALDPLALPAIALDGLQITVVRA